MPKLMSSDTMIAVAKALYELASGQELRFAVVLHGGEPLMLGRVGLDFLLTALRKALPVDFPISMQTNGILITEEILDVCSQHHTSLGVSIDGPRHVHNRHRVDHKGEGTYEQVLKGLARLRHHRDTRFLYAGVLAVIDPTTDPSDMYSFFKELDPPSVDFLYRDGNHTRLPYGKASSNSTEYGRWLAKFLDIYLADPAPIPIRVLDDLIRLILGGSSTKEGMGATDFGIVIIDTDGSIRKNDTLKSAFRGADCFDQEWSVHTHHLTDITNSSDFVRYHAMQHPTASACLACPELGVCGGGVQVHRWRDTNGYDNPSVYCADQLLLIGHVRNHLTTLLSAAKSQT
jgi:uncharacterized protein